MTKRNREAVSTCEAIDGNKGSKKVKKAPRISTVVTFAENEPVTIQIIAGSYDRVLHGFTAVIDPKDEAGTVEKSANVDQDAQKKLGPQSAQFADTFLFNAHTSAIRCVAVSPPSAPAKNAAQRVFLASGSTDERINVYTLSAHPPSTATSSSNKKKHEAQRLLDSLAPRPIRESTRNREVGTLLHHGAGITRVAFPNRAKLLSAAEDCTVAVTRTRDWSWLHAFKCPIPKAKGRPSGDTAAAANGGVGLGVPRGVNDFAVHPSMKAMITVSKGEGCMRLWNLITGKKAEAHNFKTWALEAIGEKRHSMAGGEARRVVWGRAGGEDEFAVAFERDVLVYGMDARIRCRLMRPGSVRTKLHEICSVHLNGGDGEEDGTEEEGNRSSGTVLAVSTEDGRILFFSTEAHDVENTPTHEETSNGGKETEKSNPLPNAKLLGQLGGPAAGVANRIKDFKILPVRRTCEEGKTRLEWMVVTAGSDGRIRVWQLQRDDLVPLSTTGKAKSTSHTDARQVGQLLGTYETQNRITCLAGFVMIPRPVGMEESEFEYQTEDEDDDADQDSHGSE